LKKYPKNIPKNILRFLGVGDGFNYEKKLINQKNYIKMFTTPILRWFENKTKYLQKDFTYFQVFELYFSNCHKF
jgi:hypothetical protein